MDRGAWRATVHGVAKSKTQLSNWAQHSTCCLINKKEIKLKEKYEHTRPLLWIVNWYQWPSCLALVFILTCVVLIAMLSHFSHVWLCEPMDCSLPGSSVHGILQARILEWVAVPSSSPSSWPRDLTHISCSSCFIGEFFTTSATYEAQRSWTWLSN